MKLNYSIEERIDNIALAYVTATHDVSQMTVEEFVEAYKGVFCQIEQLYRDSSC